MKIIICSPTFQNVTHGPANFANHIFEFLTLQNHQVKLITHDSSKRSDDIYLIERPIYRPIAFFWEVILSYRLYKKIKEIRKSFEADHIIFMTARLAFYPSMFLRRIKLIGLVNDYRASSAIENFSIFKRESYHWIRSFMIENFCVNKMTKVICCSDFVSKFITSKYKLENRNVKTIYQGVDLEQFNFIHPRRISKGRIRILFLKSDFEIGGLKYLIKALSLLESHEFELIVCGVDKLLSSKDIRNVDINYKGQVSRKEVVDYLGKSDILCIPSLSEGLGIALIEGLAMGIPVIASNVGGVPEVLDKGKNGYLVVPKDIRQLSANISKVINNEEQNRINAKQGREWVEEKFNILENLKSFENVLIDV